MRNELLACAIMDEFWALFAITPWEALAVVISAVAIYLVFLVYVRLFGARVLAPLATFDGVIVIMLGGLAARVILMDVPTLAAGILGLGTLFILEATFGQLRARALGNRILNQAPTAVMIDGRPQDAALASVHLSRDELMSALRVAGIRHLTEVQLAVFEPHGRISVLRVGEAIDPELLEGVRGLAARQ